MPRCLWRRERDLRLCGAPRCTPHRGVQFAPALPVYFLRCANRSLSLAPPPSNPFPFSIPRQTKNPPKRAFCLAQRKGFEPLDTFLHHTISNRARSTAPPSLQNACLFYNKSPRNASHLQGFIKNIFAKRRFLINDTVREKYEPRLWRNLFGFFLLIFLAIPRYYCVIFTKI